MAALDQVKLALRISHTKLDTEIQDAIDTAKKEMERAGILPAKILETDVLVLDAIKTYCKYSFASDSDMREGYFASWTYQLDCLRKSEGYGWVIASV